MKQSFLVLLIFLAVTGLAACGPSAVETSAAATSTSMPAVINSPVPSISPPESGPLPPEMQVVKIPSANGVELEGRYYPGALDASPLVVLMHWAPGNQEDWSAIAPWLQNRGLSITPGVNPWQQPNWFPAMPAGRSYAVLTFTFSGCKNGCKSFSQADRSQWLADAYAAADFAPGLPGVDAEKIVFAGASIGADGAADACGRLNASQPGACKGVFSLSPGGYLTLPYDAAVLALQSANPPVPVRCLYAVGDAEAAPACQAAHGSAYQTVEHTGSAHGMQLVGPGFDSTTLDRLLDLLTVLE